MMRRVVVLAALVLAGLPASAGAVTELNVIPHGQQQPGVAWATTPGMLPPEAQALMYDRLTPLGRNVTDAILQPSADGTRLLQVGPPARGRRPVAHHRRDDHGHGRRADADRPHPARRLRRAARLLGHRRRRDLRRGLRDRLRPQPAAQPGARQRARRRDRHPRRARHPAPPRPLPVRAVGGRAARGHAPAGPRAAAGRREGPPGAARPRHLPGRDQPLVRPLPARRAPVRARRHLRAQRRQGAVPRPGRRGGGPERAVPRRGARPARQAPAATTSTRTCASATTRGRPRRRAAPRRTRRTSPSRGRRASCGWRRAASAPPP